MKSFFRSGSGLGAILFLASCAQGPQFVSMPESWAEAPGASAAIAEAQATSPVTSDPYLDALHREYMQYAEFEYGRMDDWRSTGFYKDRVVAAANGQPLPPDAVGDRIIPAANQAELETARVQLVSAQEGGAIDLVPEPSAQALAAYDCWLEQQEENIQPNDIATCKERFEVAVTQMDEANAAAAAAVASTVPELITISSEVLFDFDKSDIKAAAEPVLDKVATLLQDNPDTRVTVVGHTDSTGPENYNLGLSQRRAQSVDTYLEGKGVPVDQMVASGVGESDPFASNDTPEGRAENRRVEILRIDP